LKNNLNDWTENRSAAKATVF